MAGDGGYRGSYGVGGHSWGLRFSFVVRVA